MFYTYSYELTLPALFLLAIGPAIYLALKANKESKRLKREVNDVPS